MSRRRYPAGHSIRISEETFARLILAAQEDRIDKGDMAEQAIVKALELRDRQLQHQGRRDQWRADNGTSMPRPMQEQMRPSDSFTRKR